MLRLRNVTALRTAVGRALEPTFHRLLKLKSKSQYQRTSVSASDAAKAIEWATRMLNVAQEVVSY